MVKGREAEQSDFCGWKQPWIRKESRRILFGTHQFLWGSSGGNGVGRKHRKLYDLWSEVIIFIIGIPAKGSPVVAQPQHILTSRHVPFYCVVFSFADFQQDLWYSSHFVRSSSSEGKTKLRRKDSLFCHCSSKCEYKSLEGRLCPWFRCGFRFLPKERQSLAETPALINPLLLKI